MHLWLLFTVVFSGLIQAKQTDNTPLSAIFAPANNEQVKQVETFKFKNNVDQTRAINLARALRCPQCLNQNLMESNSPIAKDLRFIVYKMVDDGKTNTDIIDFMTNRFGDFVLYNPKFETRTYLLWLGPLILVILFTIIGVVVIRKNMNNANR